MSSGAPMGIDITGNSAQAEQALDKVGKKLDQVKTKAREATLATKDMNAEMAKQLRAGAVAARGTAGAAGLGGMAGGMQVGGIMGGLAASAAAAGIVMQVVKRFSDMAEESAHRRLSIENQIRDAAEKAKDARGSSAQRGLDQEEQYQQAFAFGGQQSIEFAKRLESRGINPDVAWKTAAILPPGETEDETERRTRILTRVGNRGDDVVAAAQKIKARPWLAAMDKVEWDAGDWRRSWEISKAANAVTGKNVSPLTDRAMEADEFLRMGRENRLIKGKISAVDRDNATAGFAREPANRALRMAQNPETELRNGVKDSIDKMTANLERLAEMQGSLYRIMSDAFSPGGSYETQLIRALRDRDRVLTADP